MEYATQNILLLAIIKTHGKLFRCYPKSDNYLQAAVRNSRGLNVLSFDFRENVSRLHVAMDDFAW